PVPPWRSLAVTGSRGGRVEGIHRRLRKTRPPASSAGEAGWRPGKTGSRSGPFAGRGRFQTCGPLPSTRPAGRGGGRLGNSPGCRSVAKLVAGRIPVALLPPRQSGQDSEPGGGGTHDSPPAAE